jgi:glucan phosphoethanolaminetransferase (alkaline phosphatase superfamily)
LDEILIDAAVTDEIGRQFWRKRFLKEVFIHSCSLLKNIFLFFIFLLFTFLFLYLISIFPFFLFVLLHISLQHEVKWSTFVTAFYKALGHDLPSSQNIADKSLTLETQAGRAVHEYKCLKALLGIPFFPFSSLIFYKSYTHLAPLPQGKKKDPPVDIQTFGRVLAWFGGMQKRKKTTVLSRILSTLKQEYAK